MKDADLRDLVAKRRDASFKHVTGELATSRREAMRFYRGDNDAVYGDSGDGLSTVVSRDTMEAIESMLPALLKPFVAGDESVRFEPTGPEDEESAKQATEYVNYLFQNHNDAFRVVYDSMKDGLLYRYGCGKVVMEEVEETAYERYESLDETALAAIEADKSLTIVGDEVEQNPDGSFNVRIQRGSKRKMYRVYVVAPEQFMYEGRIASLDDATFLAHHSEKTVGDLVAMGLPKAKCKDLKPGIPDSIEGEERSRYDDEPENLDSDDPARKVWVDECYVRCDYERDGTLSWRKVIIAGNDNTLLLDEEADGHPFVGWTPIPEPHKLVGRSFADLTKDIQMQKTALKREGLNALYLSNRPQREVVEGQVNIDDLLNPTVGGIVRVKSQGMVTAIPSGGDGVMGATLQMIEALDSEREARTGVTRYNQGMDANSLNHTATGVSIISNASMQRQELVARQYAESFLKPAFGKMLKLVSRYQDKAAVIRLRGEWVEFDPSDWKTGYDMSVAVGLGTGNKDQVIGQITNLLNIDQQIVGLQGGINGPLLTGENIYEKLKRMVEAMGLKGVERYYTDPAPKEGAEGSAQPEPDPAAAEQAAQQQAMEADAAKHTAELEQKHATAVETATIAADAQVRVASINAVKELVVAGLTPDEADAVVQAAPDVFGEPDGYVPQGDSAMEGDDMGQMMPQEPAQEPAELDPELLAALIAEQPGEAPDEPVPDILL